MKGIPDLLEMSSTSLGGEDGLIYSNNCFSGCADRGSSVRWLGFFEKLLVAVVNAGGTGECWWEVQSILGWPTEERFPW